MKKPLLAAALAAALVTTSGCGVVMRFIGDMTANAITQKTADLKQVSARISYTTNLYPASLGLTEHDYYGEAWKDGANLVGVSFFKRWGVGLYELDGNVGVLHDDKGAPQPLPYLGKGSYSMVFPASDKRPKTIVIHTASGQQARFTVKPAMPIGIKAINGKAPSGATLDLSRDLTLDLDHPKGAGGRIKVSVVIETMGVKTFTEVGVFKHAGRLVIPKEAFRNLQVSGSHAGFVHIQKGASGLLVERFEDAYPAHALVGATEISARALAYAPVNVVGDAPANASLSHSEPIAFAAGAANASFFKSSAFYAPPLTPGKTFGVGLLRAHAKLYESKTTTNSTESLGVRYTTTTTVIKDFPELPEAHWQRMMSELERSLAATLQKETGIRLVGPGQVAKSPTYRSLPELEASADERGGQTYFATKVIAGSRQVFPNSLTGIIAETSSTFPADRPISRMVKESGLDGILVADLTLSIASNADNHIVLVPGLNWVVYGGAHGNNFGPMAFGSGSIVMADGVPFNEAQLRADPNGLVKVARIPDLAAAFGKSLRSLREKEKAAGYDKIWQHQ